jgi:hypothetical protein
MQVNPQPASTIPPSGREPVATATANPAIRPAAAIGAVATRSLRPWCRSVLEITPR